MRKKVQALQFLLVLGLLLPSFRATASQIEFLIGSGGQVQFDGGAPGTIVGINLPVLTVLGIDTPQNQGVTLTLAAGSLMSFQTGAVYQTVVVPAIGAQPAYQIYAADAGGYVTGLNIMNGNLLSGAVYDTQRYTQLMISSASGSFGGDFSVYALNDLIKSFYNVGDSWTGSITLRTGKAANMIGTTGFKSDEGAITLTSVPLPPAAWLSGAGLLGLLGIRKRINH